MKLAGVTMPAVALWATIAAAAPQPGPVITFFGAVSPQSIPLQCGSMTPENVPICQLASASNFFFVVEGRPGPSMSPVGLETFNAVGLPDLQIQVDRPLGDGSAAVCDNMAPNRGGVAPLSPPDLDFSDPGPVNDFACRFTAEVCTLDPRGEPRFLVPSSTVQFCVEIDPVLAFADGDTRITARLRDVAGGVTLEPRQVVLRAGGMVLTPTRTIPMPATPTRTATAPATPTHTGGVAVTPTVEPLPGLDDVIAAIYAEVPPAPTDINDDGRVTAADVTALILDL